MDFAAVVFFDDKIKNGMAAQEHFGIYAVNYDANAGQKLEENAQIREILDYEHSRRAARALSQIRAQRAAAGYTQGLGLFDEAIKFLEGLKETADAGEGSTRQAEATGLWEVMRKAAQREVAAEIHGEAIEAQGPQNDDTGDAETEKRHSRRRRGLQSPLGRV